MANHAYAQIAHVCARRVLPVRGEYSLAVANRPVPRPTTRGCSMLGIAHKGRSAWNVELEILTFVTPLNISDCLVIRSGVP
jgi:hypothetical protein